jgi:hypothetical protein
LNHHLLGFQQVWDQLMCTILYHVTIQFNPLHFIIIWMLLFLNYTTWFYFDSQLVINQFNSQIYFLNCKTWLYFNIPSITIHIQFKTIFLTYVWHDLIEPLNFRAYNTSLSILLPFLFCFALFFHHTPNE